jgi:excisionase family DNA binding protein
MRPLSTTEAARELNVSQSRIRQLIAQQRIAVEKIDGRNFIWLADLAAVRLRPNGRPRVRTKLIGAAS